MDKNKILKEFKELEYPREYLIDSIINICDYFYLYENKPLKILKVDVFKLKRYLNKISNNDLIGIIDDEIFYFYTNPLEKLTEVEIEKLKIPLAEDEQWPEKYYYSISLENDNNIAIEFNGIPE